MELLCFEHQNILYYCQFVHLHDCCILYIKMVYQLKKKVYYICINIPRNAIMTDSDHIIAILTLYR